MSTQVSRAGTCFSLPIMSVTVCVLSMFTACLSTTEGHLSLSGLSCCLPFCVLPPYTATNRQVGQSAGTQQVICFLSLGSKHSVYISLWSDIVLSLLFKSFPSF